MNKRLHKKFFIQEHLHEPYQNGGIGYTDAERIMVSENYQPLFLPCHFSFSLMAKLRRALSLLRIFITIPAGSTVVLLLPQHATMNKWLIRILGLRPSVKRVAVLGDINGIKHNDPALLKKELKEFASYDFLIVHNGWMEEWIRQQLPGARCSQLLFFDFLAEQRNRVVTQRHTVAYAGNLHEGGFLNKVGELLPENESIVFRVYGQPYTDRMAAQPNLEYQGTSEPYALPGRLEAGYGLIWYGESIDAVQGNIGPYLSLITPHKASLYLLCGIPLIVPEGTAIAGLVKEYKLGIVISSLRQLRSRMYSVSEEEYAAMCTNAREMAGMVAAGEGMRKALHEMEKALQRGLSQ